MENHISTVSKEIKSGDYSFKTKGRVIYSESGCDGMSRTELVIYLYKENYVLDYGTVENWMAPGYGVIECIPVSYAKNHTIDDLREQYPGLCGVLDAELSNYMKLPFLWNAMFGRIDDSDLQ